ncbi:MAG: right-handed parallel beta-helix repeat-containing protein [bacterium]|nr:right-handed parallel beta-helix repeat-containing protein [bacterium]MBU1918706.1 right-handed parallel beta-helix repeat-containing protein [bacterium]
MKVYKYLFLVILVFSYSCGSSSSTQTTTSEKSGDLTADETWSGTITVTASVVVPEDVTLTISPGTVVKFNHYRGYTDPSQRAGLYVMGGTLIAEGTAEEQIWFTSDADEPINGDWSGIEISDSTDTIIKYAIVEFATLGVNQVNSEATISYSIIRWNNTEGLYAERSTPLIEYNTLYSNGYHEIALEQYNEDVIIRNNYFYEGRAAIHTEKTSSTVEDNYFLDYLDEAITAQADSTMMVTDNIFIDTPEGAVAAEADSTMTESGNTYVDSPYTVPDFDYEDITNHVLDYIPGDDDDEYLYVYDAEDTTRKVIDTIGAGLGFGWALTYANNYIWRFSFSNQTGDYPDFVRIDPDTEETTRYENNTIINPRGLTYDGTHFWTNDFSELKIYKFSIDGDEIDIISSFDVPDKDSGGTNGLTNDGTYLYYHSRDGNTLYKLNKDGTTAETIDLSSYSVNMEGPFVWTGDGFWATGGIGIVRYDEDWDKTDELYPPAEGTWALDWDGTYLWTIQRTCERWDEEKVYKIEPL